MSLVTTEAEMLALTAGDLQGFGSAEVAGGGMVETLHNTGYRCFASDNRAGGPPEGPEALGAANGGHQVSCGEDVYTERLQQRVRAEFGDAAEAFPVFNGTGANVVALTAVLPRWGAVSATQTTELGTVYTPAEVRAIADFAHGHGMALHVDGARIWNAAAALGVPFREFTTDTGVDILSFGGTKNGLLGAEAVVVIDPTRV